MEDPPPPPPPPQRLRCAVQHYEWGRRGAASIVARLADQQDPDLARADTRRARPRRRRAVGRRPPIPLQAGAGNAGYVQVLSVAKALSIQAHPDKKRAEALHALRPSVYKDDNHKPEMAIAITEFRALYGFAAIQELKDVLRTVPEVEGLIGHEHAAKLMSFKEYDAVA
nr:mannose-6-phosphate isomerase 1-like [Oryza sativa Japonica Group]